MLFNLKAVALVLSVTSAIAGPIPSGDYLITNVQYDHGAVCVYEPFRPVYVCNKPRAPFSIWTFRDAEDGGYTIENHALHTFLAVRTPRDGEPVITDRIPMVFNIEPAGDDEFIIKLPYYDFLLNAEPPGPLGEEIKLRPAEGWESQKWRFIPGPLLRNHNYDRWNLPQQIGRLLGYI